MVVSNLLFSDDRFGFQFGFSVMVVELMVWHPCMLDGANE